MKTRIYPISVWCLCRRRRRPSRCPAPCPTALYRTMHRTIA